jgi:hypothetical protein
MKNKSLVFTFENQKIDPQKSISLFLKAVYEAGR